MQDPPDKTVLLGATAAFLLNEVRPAVQDPSIRYRLLIAAHLCGVVAREITGETEQDLQETTRLKELLKGLTDEGPADNQALADALRDSRLPLATALPHLTETLREKLRLLNPAFDLSSEIE